MNKLQPRPRFLRRLILRFLCIFDREIGQLSEKDVAAIGTKLLFFNVMFSFLIGRSRHKYIHFTSKIIDPENLHIEGIGSSNFKISLAASPCLYIQCHNSVNVHCSTLIGPGVKIISANHSNKLDRNDHEFADQISIESGVWLGASSVVLPGVTIHKNAIVGAGAIVTKNIIQCSVVAGNPAREIR